MKNTTIAAGGMVNCNGKIGVIGALVKYKDKYCVLTVYHLIKWGECEVGDLVGINGFFGQLIGVLPESDLAIIEILLPADHLEVSEIGDAKIGPAYVLNGKIKNKCQIMTVGHTYHYLAFGFGFLPLPGDSGSPLIQDDKVVGILASVFYNNAAGIAISLENFRR